MCFVFVFFAFHLGRNVQDPCCHWNSSVLVLAVLTQKKLQHTCLKCLALCSSLTSFSSAAPAGCVRMLWSWLFSRPAVMKPGELRKHYLQPSLPQSASAIYWCWNTSVDSGSSIMCCFLTKIFNMMERFDIYFSAEGFCLKVCNFFKTNSH